MREGVENEQGVLEFWLGALDAQGLASSETSSRWWKKDAAFDAEIRQRFERTYDAIAAGECEEWLETPRGRLAYVIVLDQFSRNMFRGTAKMFAADERALRAALGGVESGDDQALVVDERVFLYMPLMHSEDIAMQERCVALLERYAEQLGADAYKRVANNADFARRHRDIVVKWGRFPHRNATLGRESTPAEQAFLAEPGSSF